MRIRKKTTTVIFHHSCTDIGSVKAFRKYHVEVKKWEEIGYHFVIQKDGVVGSGRDTRYIGSHAYGRNSISIGICMVGNFHNYEPTVEQIEASGNLYHALCRQYGKSLKVKFHRPHIFNIFESSTYGMWNACTGTKLDRNDFVEQMAKYDPYKEFNT